jgi:hypothetical protein
MRYTIPTKAERVRAVCARLLLACTLLLALSGQAATILHVPLPGWQHPLILADSIVVVALVIVRTLFPPRRASGHGGGR